MDYMLPYWNKKSREQKVAKSRNVLKKKLELKYRGVFVPLAIFKTRTTADRQFCVHVESAAAFTRNFSVLMPQKVP